MNRISMVVGSWGSYNECNERALGSKWLDFDDFEDWNEVETELAKQGFDLEGIDEELFIQDIEGLPTDACNWDYTHPKTLFQTIKDSGVLEDEYEYEKMLAYIEVRSYEDFENLIDSKGSKWGDDIYLYQNYNWEDYGRNYFENCCYELPGNLEDFIDFEAYGKYMGDYYAQEYSNGIIEIL